MHASMHSPKNQKAHRMRLNRRTVLPQYCQGQAEQEGSRLTRWRCARQSVTHRPHTPHTQTQAQAVRKIGPLSYTCYQASTCGLYPSWSGWILDALAKERGKSSLGGGFALRCFQRLSLLDVAIQLWPGQANWHTSGPAISVLSYWR